MAADVTLMALPNTPENQERFAYKTFEVLFDTDDVYYVEDIMCVSNGGFERVEFDNQFYKDIDYLEIGPVSYIKSWLFGDDAWLPGPTVAVQDLWNMPRIVTPKLITQTMAAMNLPDDSHYKNFTRKKCSRRKVKNWLNAHLGWIVLAEAW